MIVLLCLPLLLIPSVHSTKDPPEWKDPPPWADVAPFRTLDPVPDWYKHRDYCAIRNSSRNSDGRPLWLIYIKNHESGSFYPAALISPIHAIVHRAAVTQTVSPGGEERLTRQFNLKAHLFGIPPKFTSEKGHFYIGVNHTVVPLDAQRWRDGVLDDLAIIQLEENVLERVETGQLSFLCQRDTAPTTKETYEVYFGTDLINPHEGKEKSTNEKDRHYKRHWDVSNLYPTEIQEKPVVLVSAPPSYCNPFNLKKPCPMNAHSSAPLTGTTGSIWVERQWNENKTDRIIGISINESSALLLSYWEPFVCRHTGVCLSEKTRHESSRPSDTRHRPFVMDNSDKPPIVEECSAAWKGRALEDSTLLTRLTREEAKDVNRTCGDKTAGLTKFQVLLESGYRPDRENIPGVPQRERCFGVIISPLHVATTAECLEKLGRSNDEKTIRVFYRVEENEWKNVTVWRVAIPYDKVMEDEITHNFALLEVESRMEGVTIACLPSKHHDEKNLQDILYNAWDLKALYYASDDFFVAINNVNSAVGLNRRCVANGICDLLYYDKLTVEHLHEMAAKNPMPKMNEKGTELHDVRLEMEIVRPETGSPLTEVVDGRRVLNALTSNWDAEDDDLADLVVPDRKNGYLAINVTAYRTFICIHTGLWCEKQSDYEGRNFLPFEMSGTTPASIKERFKQRKKRMHFLKDSNLKNLTNWQAAKDEMDHWGNYISHSLAASFPSVLAKEQNERTKRECGRSSIDSSDYWPTLVVYNSSNEESMCSGSLISPLHILTSRTCVAPFRIGNTTVKVKHNEFWEHTTTMDVGTVIYVDDPDTPDDLAVDVAVIEMMHPIHEDHYKRILCLPERGYEWQPEYYWFGRSNNRNSRKTMKATDESTRHPVENGQEYISFTDKYGRDEWLTIPIGNISGTPFIRKRVNGDGRLFLYGMATPRQIEGKPVYSKIDKLLSLICRMTGVCPPRKNKKANWDEEDALFKEKQLYIFNDQKLCL